MGLDVRDRWDLWTARLSLRWVWLARCYAFVYSLRWFGGKYDVRSAYRLARGMRRPEEMRR